MDNKIYKVGFDIGSTTVKIVVLDKITNKIIFSFYKKHNSDPINTIILVLRKIAEIIKNNKFNLVFTGSIGMGLSENFNIPFVQEVIAAKIVVEKYYSSSNTLIDIGGEDSKIVFFDDNNNIDVRMNDLCAAGTGAFIEQMINLLGINYQDISRLDATNTEIYTIASRCGVFAKSDVQMLLAKGISKESIIISVLDAISLQVINSLSRGKEIQPQIIFIGGTCQYYPQIVERFRINLKLEKKDIIFPDNAIFFPALGAAISDKVFEVSLEELVSLLKDYEDKKTNYISSEKALFDSVEDASKWLKNKQKQDVKLSKIEDYEHNGAFLGIDCGSTTTKIAIIGINNELLFKYYSKNDKNPIDKVQDGINEFKKECRKFNKSIDILYSVVTGYGEDLIKAAFNIDKGVVETIAHFVAAKYFNKDVDFILDIGGQDIKAIFINNGIIERIEINEACSSGCGSFIETFAKTNDFTLEEFSKMALEAKFPYDLGTRCTVFINSKVKQALKENCKIENIALGISYSVVKNAFHKVLKINSKNEIGKNIVLHGGVFKNHSITRCLEKILDREVSCSSIPEMMGALGCSFIAKESYLARTELSTIKLQKEIKQNKYTISNIKCGGCLNNCKMTKYSFENSKNYFSGNICEKIYSNKGKENIKKFENIVEYKYNLLFEQKKTNNKINIGIPRVLNIYDNFPFFNTLFTNCGFNVVLSSDSSLGLYQKATGLSISDSVCFPSKLVNAHILDLKEKNVDRIFYPSIIYEKNNFDKAHNSYNCPIISFYPDVAKSVVEDIKHFDKPALNFNDNNLLKSSLWNYFKMLGVTKNIFNDAYKESILQQDKFKKTLKTKAKEIIKRSIENDEHLIVLSGRPYHIDKLVSHKISQIIVDMGANVITEDSVEDVVDMLDLEIVSQWQYTNRIYNAAKWVANKVSSKINFVQLNSFGCGLDAISSDECKKILERQNKPHTLIKIDDIQNSGAVKLRIRSLLESIEMQQNKEKKKIKEKEEIKIFEKIDKKRKIIFPYFSDIYSSFVPILADMVGYNFVLLPAPNKESVKIGLEYCNNEICYPAIIIVGDILKAIRDNNYKEDEIAIAFTQTGGQCRASSYYITYKKSVS